MPHNITRSRKDPASVGIDTSRLRVLPMKIYLVNRERANLS